MSATGDSWKGDANFADSVARACHEHYATLPKTGKPNVVTEWTVLSGVVRLSERPPTLEVVALGTGSKCLGSAETSATGDALNDAHAEVVARRTFLRYLYDQVERFYATGRSEVFQREGQGMCAVARGVSFHFYASAMPCGDATIFAKDADFGDDRGDCVERGRSSPECVTLTKSSGTDSEMWLNETSGEGNCTLIPNADDFRDYLLASVVKKNSEDGSKQGDSKKHRVALTESSGGDYDSSKRICRKESTETVETAGTKRKSESSINDESELAWKQPKTSGNSAVKTASKQSEKNVKTRPANDIHRTGAKCVPSDRQDLHSPGVGYHVLGALRTKPGRGDPTLSLSCSDKLARWNAVGCQGALLSLLVEPIRFRSLTIGGGCPFSREALTRAVVERTRLLNVDPPPSILRASVAFPDGRPAGGCRLPCPSSIAWCRVADRPLEVAVKGRKQGVTKKVAHTSAGRLQICKRELAQRFVSVATSSDVVLKVAECDMDARQLARMPYARLKAMAEKYQREWRATREQCFPAWPTKPASFLEFTLDM